MKWETLTAPDFAQAVEQTGVCLLTLGVLERHGDHLPLGTDYINVHRLACLAAEQEPAVVFPPFYFGQIYEARCYPGTVTIEPTLLIRLIQGVMDEIGRNGFRKIILVNGHGGNEYMLPFLAQCTLWEEKPYAVYLYTGELSAERQQAWKDLLETDIHMHACECETSLTLANTPDLVKMERVPSHPATPLNRLQHLKANFSGISWYANYPEHYAGDARLASAEKGKRIQALMVSSLAEFIVSVKADQIVPGLNHEFFRRVETLER